ncbi:hypothetical protein ASG40_08140 [Methylobacterium sp. Leaf399]|uniref:SHOCT domain-containing protein n=1 Tax=Methylobacterium sp. Leaf399 TaxID=1736364 RepID=UPI0006F1C9A8|nr:SHOCT domain-containing protein [Methylobacterium sp. Leaf399]KQT11947.1 hypothetical protein ASG40_08140 [Methylobacterium sp. Leaf399]
MTDQSFEAAGELQALADRHGVGLDAVRHLAQALEAGHGAMAQFNHPDLGGFGQWSTGGMIMIGQMFDTALKARVAALCDELSRSLPALGRTGAAAGQWWPANLGRPSTSGAQNGLRYAYFPESRRLAVESDGALSLYDTGIHDISGVSLSQGGGTRLRFSGRGGPVELDQLTRLDGQAPPRPPESRPPESRPPESRPPEPRPFYPDPVVPMAPAPEAPPEPAPAPETAGGDVLATLEKLAALHAKGVLTEAEFSSKKAELLARL